MASVNATRGSTERKIARATEHAKLVGFNDDGHICVWSGGFTFNVYDAARDWQEVRHFTSGTMVDQSDENLARERMEDEGFDVV